MILKYILLFLILLFICMVVFPFAFSWIFNLMKKSDSTKDIFLTGSENSLLYKNNVSRSQYVAVIEHENADKEWNRRFVYKGKKDCALFKKLYESETECKTLCIGFGSCAIQCSQEAIIIKDGRAMVTNACNGCGKCVNVCPNSLIKLVQNREIYTAGTVIQKKEYKFWKMCYNLFHLSKS